MREIFLNQLYKILGLLQEKEINNGFHFLADPVPVAFIQSGMYFFFDIHIPRHAGGNKLARQIRVCSRATSNSYYNGQIAHYPPGRTVKQRSRQLNPGWRLYFIMSTPDCHSHNISFMPYHWANNIT
jgi:hypothetical protein